MMAIEVLTAGEIGARLGVSPLTVRLWFRDRLLPATSPPEPGPGPQLRPRRKPFRLWARVEDVDAFAARWGFGAGPAPRVLRRPVNARRKWRLEEIYLTQEEAAKILGVNVTTLRKWIDRGRIPTEDVRCLYRKSRGLRMKRRIRRETLLALVPTLGRQAMGCNPRGKVNAPD